MSAIDPRAVTIESGRCVSGVASTSMSCCVSGPDAVAAAMLNITRVKPVESVR